MSLNRNSLLNIFLIVFIDLVGFGIVIPILPYYAQTFGASAWELGWLMTSFSLMQFIFAPFWGRISDRFGRRPVLLGCLVGTIISMTILGFAHTLLLLFIGRFLAGIFGASISTAYAYIADVTDESNRAKGMGIIGAGFGLGFIFGPAIGGVLSQWGYSVPMFAAAGLASINLVYAAFKLEEPKISEEIRTQNRNRRFDVAALKIAFSERTERIAILLFFGVTFAMTQMEAIFALYLSATFHYDARTAGMLLALSGIIMVLIQGGLIGRLVKFFGESKLVTGGALLCSMGLLGFALAPDPRLLVAALVIMSLGHGLLHPTLSSLASRGSSRANKGIVMGVFQSAGSLARVLGPPIAGWFFDSVSRRSPLFSAAAITAIIGVLAWVTLIRASHKTL
ncbi:MFS transporter [Bdellovibrionota bacterium FG-2]